VECDSFICGNYSVSDLAMNKGLFFSILITISAIVYGTEQPSKTGFLKVQLPELPQPQLEPVLLPGALNPKAEVFEIFVPPTYDAAKTYIVLAWVNPDNTAEIPRQFESIFADNEFIVISAERIGNNQPWQRRIGILESAITQLSKTMHLDPTKRIMSGFSGGGRVSAMACFIHPEFWKAAISWAGGNFYKTYEIPMPVGATKQGINDYDPNIVSNEHIKKARSDCSFVLITGSKDFNLNDSRGIHRAMRRENFHSLLLEQPGLGHEVGTAEYMQKAIDFVLTTKTQS
jgi:Prolyl oligopeptidase family